MTIGKSIGIFNNGLTNSSSSEKFWTNILLCALKGEAFDSVLSSKIANVPTTVIDFL